MATKRMKELEAKLTLQQRKAAMLCVENEIMAAKGERKTQEELAEEIGMTRMGLYKWRTQNKTFIEYMNALADDMLSAHRSEVYSQLLKSIRGEQPSIKAIDLYLKRFGLLTERQVTESVDGSESRDSASIEKELRELDDLLGEEGAGEQGEN